jgi:hypothetical protein
MTEEFRYVVIKKLVETKGNKLVLRLSWDVLDAPSTVWFGDT